MGNLKTNLVATATLLLTVLPTLSQIPMDKWMGSPSNFQWTGSYESLGAGEKVYSKTEHFAGEPAIVKYMFKEFGRYWFLKQIVVYIKGPASPAKAEKVQSFLNQNYGQFIKTELEWGKQATGQTIRRDIVPITILHEIDTSMGIQMVNFFHSK